MYLVGSYWYGTFKLRTGSVKVAHSAFQTEMRRKKMQEDSQKILVDIKMSVENYKGKKTMSFSFL
jgi:hypothetical protein